jgi:hypothetical protein
MQSEEPHGAGLMKGGSKMLNVGAKVGAGLLCAAAFVLSCAGPGAAQGKDLSDKSVQLLMQYAWALTPPKFTSPDGKTIEVDKSKPKDVMVDVVVAREVIKVARLSAYAQQCGLLEEQRANYQTLMRREVAKSKWTDQQLLYISQLHLFTVMTLTGKVQVVQNEGDKKVVVEESKAAKAASCDPGQRDRVKAQIVSYINSGPAGAPSKTAEPAKASQKK